MCPHFNRFINHQDPMQVIGHDHKLVQYHKREMRRDFFPTVLGCMS